jgi:hypothetical protein
MGHRNLEREENLLTQERPTRKPYIKPTFRHEKVFVTTALSCGKTGPLETNCRLNGTKAS